MKLRVIRSHPEEISEDGKKFVYIVTPGREKQESAMVERFATAEPTSGTWKSVASLRC
ncbi:MAG: hypothetical protein WJ306_03135 [Ferrovum myxofaciens]